MTTERPSAASGPWFTGGQLGWLGVQWAVIAVLGLFLAATKADYVTLLWSDPLGLKMAASAAGLLAVGSAIYLAGCLFLNRYGGRSPTGRGVGYWLFTAVFVPLCFVVFFLPAVFTIMVGPAAIQIQRQLLHQ
jgi:hypothetical protein